MELKGQAALTWLKQRGLTELTIKRARLGWNPQDRYDPPHLWGFNGGNRMYIPEGWFIPWFYKGQLVGIRVRRSDDALANSDASRYLNIRVYSQTKTHWHDHNFLYNADDLKPGRPVMLVEGELDALSVKQEAGDLIVAVATGSVSGGRGKFWRSQLAKASVVLVAFDADTAGDKNSLFWTETLSNTIRWRPLADDPNQMLQNDPEQFRVWVVEGLKMAEAQIKRPE